MYVPRKRNQQTFVFGFLVLTVLSFYAYYYTDVSDLRRFRGLIIASTGTDPFFPETGEGGVEFVFFSLLFPTNRRIPGSPRSVVSLSVCSREEGIVGFRGMSVGLTLDGEDGLRMSLDQKDSWECETMHGDEKSEKFWY